MNNVKLAPSVLSADFGRLTEQIGEAADAGADWLHLDVMDGRFVPNITFGPVVVEVARRATALPLDVHLMIEQPERYVERFAGAGVNSMTVHVETCPHLHRTLQQIRELGVRAGAALNPATPVEMVRDVLPLLDLVLVMSVNPGFGGQQYIPTSTRKVARLREELDRGGYAGVELQVDGGISAATAAEVVRAGATVLVAGSAVYNSRASVAENMRALRQAAVSAVSTA